MIIDSRWYDHACDMLRFDSVLCIMMRAGVVLQAKAISAAEQNSAMKQEEYSL